MTLDTSVKFADFNLRPELLKALESKGFESPMPVQVRVLEDQSLTESDLIVQARTGSGKTLAFALPLINNMDARQKEPQIIVLSPTRELAQQTAREFAWLGAFLGVRVATLVGGLDMERQIRALRDGANIVIGTPGRILDHVRRGTLKTSAIKSVVLDEGDHMLDMGFRDEMEAILNAMDGIERTWLFSATMPPEVLSLSRQYLDAPKKISLVSDVTTHEDISQKAYIIPSRKRFEGLANVLIWEAPSRALLFCGTRAETQDIAEKLCDIGFRATAIHGDMSQRERNSALGALRGGRVSILVATDVAARGLDIEAVSHVIQFGLPQNLEAFVHRSGRTGRAGHEGSNMVLLTAREAKQFKYMTSSSKLKMEWIPAPDASEIAGHARVRFEKIMIDHALESDEFEGWAKDILERDEALMLVSGLISKAYGDQPAGYSIREDVSAEMSREKSRGDRAPTPAKYNNGRQAGGAKKERSGPRNDMSGGCAVQFSKGRADGLEVGALLGLICRCIGVGREDVGNIKLRDHSASVELSSRGAALLDARKDRLETEGLSCSSVRAIEASKDWHGRKSEGERRGSSGDHRDRDRAPRRERPSEGNRDGARERKRRFAR